MRQYGATYPIFIPVLDPLHGLQAAARKRVGVHLVPGSERNLSAGLSQEEARPSSVIHKVVHRIQLIEREIKIA
jgi:hypothetical protein